MNTNLRTTIGLALAVAGFGLLTGFEALTLYHFMGAVLLIGGVNFAGDKPSK